MAFDGIVTNAVAYELQHSLIEGKINKIWQPNKNEIALSFYTRGVTNLLSINISSNEYALHLTKYTKPNPMNPFQFCMVLRKHLIGYQLIKIETFGLERIIIFVFEGFNELNDIVHKKLVVELMGKHSNILLVNENYQIIDAIRHFDLSSQATRPVLPNYIYSFPENCKKDILSFSTSEIDTLLDTSSQTTIQDLFTTHFAGISKTFITHLSNMLSISCEKSKSNFLAIYEYIVNLLHHLENASIITLDNDYTIEYNSQKEPLEVNLFLDEYFYQKDLKTEFETYRNTVLQYILNYLKKVNKKLFDIEEKLNECKNMEQYKLYGELLTNYLYKLTQTHQSQIIVENYYANNEPITIPLDISLSPADNAKKYFKKYRKLKSTGEIVNEQKREIEKEIAYLESIVYELDNVKTIKEIDEVYDEITQNMIPLKRNTSFVKKKITSSKKQLTTSDFLTYTINNFKVLVGKNNEQNDYLTTKLAKSSDLWFHVKDIHGSHVILKIENEQPSQSIINQVASIAAYYSKAKDSSNVAVDYTYTKFVKKPSKSKPGMVIYTNQKTVNVQPRA